MTRIGREQEEKRERESNKRGRDESQRHFLHIVCIIKLPLAMVWLLRHFCQLLSEWRNHPGQQYLYSVCNKIYYSSIVTTSTVCIICTVSVICISIQYTCHISTVTIIYISIVTIIIMY